MEWACKRSHINWRVLKLLLYVLLVKYAILYSLQERTPSWTDRILYKVKSTCSAEAELMLYDSIPELKISDHKPVVAHLTLKKLLRTSSSAF